MSKARPSVMWMRKGSATLRSLNHGQEIFRSHSRLLLRSTIGLILNEYEL